MKKLILPVLLCSLLLILLQVDSYAQYYERSAGLRFGGSSGVTFKQFFTEEQSMEVLLSGRRNGLQLTGIYQFNRPLEITLEENLFAYYGIGAHVGYEEFNERIVTLTPPAPPVGPPFPPGNADIEFRNQTNFVMGIDAVLGIEYRFLGVPLTAGFDLKPYFSFIGMRYTRTRFWDASLSLKYVF